MIGPNTPGDAKARHLRALYRQHAPKLVEHTPGKVAIDQRQQAEQSRIVKAEYERLYPDGGARLDQILVNAWTEGRELAGQRYDYVGQCWRDAEGNRVD